MSALKGNLDVAAVGLALALAEQAHQTRHTRDRGRLLVHAAKKLVKDVDAELAVENEFGTATASNTHVAMEAGPEHRRHLARRQEPQDHQL